MNNTPNQGKCKTTNDTGVFLSTTFNCLPGFYCPYANPAIPNSLPQFCVPDAICQLTRLQGSVCLAQGAFEPVVCSPEGSFCPTGSTAPFACAYLSSCPAGSTSQTFYGGLLICAVIDVALIIVILIFLRRDNIWQTKTLKIAASSEETRMQIPYHLKEAAILSSSDEDLLRAFSKGFAHQKLSMRFNFESLAYSVGKKQIIKSVSGCIRPGKLTAIMGPSGAGKTSFMSVLMGKVKRTSGQLFLNSSPTEMATHKKMIGFVPQEDIMLKELTVYENIRHSARIRLPASWSNAEIDHHVRVIIQALNLGGVANVQIGSESTRGISGGQRKRVNIAIELAAVPLALFLDEPTSGLDSTAALAVTDILKSIAGLGPTVVMVLHQPRIEIFEALDDILLIVPGGETAYIGPMKKCQPYFESLGYHFNAGSNPADVLMDILSSEAKSGSLPEKWREYVLCFRSDGVDPALVSSEKLFYTNIPELSKKRGAFWIEQVYYCCTRYFLQQFRNYTSLILEITVGLVAGLLMGVSVSPTKGELYTGIYVAPYSIISSAPFVYVIPLYGLLIGFSVALAASPAGVKVFSEEKPVFWRESAAGHSSSAYYIGKTAGSLPRLVLSSLHFTAIYIYFAIPTFPTFSMMYAIILLTFFGVYGMSALVSCVVSQSNSNLLSVIFAIFAASFCGFGPTLRDASDWGVSFVWDMSFNRWATEALFSSSISPLSKVYITSSSAAQYGYTLGRENFDLAIMFTIGIAFRAAAFVALKLRNRDKQ